MPVAGEFVGCPAGNAAHIDGGGGVFQQGKVPDFHDVANVGVVASGSGVGFVEGFVAGTTCEFNERFWIGSCVGFPTNIGWGVELAVCH